MEKVYVNTLQQNKKVFYSGKIDPHKIADLLPDIKTCESQESQRPWVEKSKGNFWIRCR